MHPCTPNTGGYIRAVRSGEDSDDKLRLGLQALPLGGKIGEFIWRLVQPIVVPLPMLPARLAVYLKALACNVKRMVRARLDEMLFPPAALATAPCAA